MTIRSQNPATGEIGKTFDVMPTDAVDDILNRVLAAQQAWQGTDFAERTRYMMKVALLLEERSEALAEIAVFEMGKTFAEAVAEVKKCAWVCRHYAENATGYLAPVSIQTDAAHSYVRYDALGVVLAVMPWNFPYWQVFRFIAPNMMAGNGGLLKHAPNVPQCALAIETLMRDAGFPPDLFRVLLIEEAPVAQLIADPRIAGVTLTGSDRAGSAVGAAAGHAIKPVVMELGGADPFIVLADADLEKAADMGTLSRCLNNGQSCIAAKRFIVVDSVYDEFVSHLEDRLSQMAVGDPMDLSTNIGPLARNDLRENLHRQVESMVAEGAVCRLGGTIPDGAGFFYPPTLLVDVPADSVTAREETFGPLASVIRVSTVEEAVSVANETEFGLGASVWTKDPSVIRYVVPKLQAGAVFVNGFVKSDPRLPFGGVKRSGVGRELGRDGILEFVNRKTVWVG